MSGPGWLDIALDGTVSGTPDDADVGQNGFIVSVTDTSELQDTAILYLQVLNTFGGHWGLDDLSVFAQHWLEADCVDVPACGGADLSSDQDVTLTDYSMLSTNWNTGFVPGLVADWWMDDSAGFVLRDNYRELDGVLYAADEISGWDDALLLDGTDDYAEITGYYGILGNSARTVSFWIQTSQTSDGTTVSWGESGWPWGGQWSVLVSGGKLKVNVGFGYATGTTQINDNQWHHIAVVLPSSASPVSEDIELYVDGFLETLSAYNNVDIDTRSGTIPIELTIGRDASVQTAYFNGKIDNLRIYEIALQLSEIESLAGL